MELEAKALAAVKNRVASLEDAEFETMTFGSFYKAMKVKFGAEIKPFKKAIKAALREAIKVRFAGPTSPAAEAEAEEEEEEEEEAAAEASANDSEANASEDVANDSEASASPSPKRKKAAKRKRPVAKGKKKKTKTKRTPSAYQLWTKTKSKEVRNMNPDLGFGDVTRETAKQWREASVEDKAPYVEKARVAKAKAVERAAKKEHEANRGSDDDEDEDAPAPAGSESEEDPVEEPESEAEASDQSEEYVDKNDAKDDDYEDDSPAKRRKKAAAKKKKARDKVKAKKALENAGKSPTEKKKRKKRKTPKVKKKRSGTRRRSGAAAHGVEIPALPTEATAFVEDGISHDVQLELHHSGTVRWFRLQLCMATRSESEIPAPPENAENAESATRTLAVPASASTYCIRTSWGDGPAGAREDNDAGFAAAAAAAAQAEAVESAFADASTRCARVVSFKGELALATKRFSKLFVDKTGQQWKGGEHVYSAPLPGQPRFRVASAAESARRAAAAQAGSSGARAAVIAPQRRALHPAVARFAQRVVVGAADGDAAVDSLKGCTVRHLVANDVATLRLAALVANGSARTLALDRVFAISRPSEPWAMEPFMAACGSRTRQLLWFAARATSSAAILREGAPARALAPLSALLGVAASEAAASASASAASSDASDAPSSTSSTACVLFERAVDALRDECSRDAVEATPDASVAAAAAAAAVEDSEDEFDMELAAAEPPPAAVVIAAPRQFPAACATSALAAMPEMLLFACEAVLGAETQVAAAECAALSRAKVASMQFTSVQVAETLAAPSAALRTEAFNVTKPEVVCCAVENDDVSPAAFGGVHLVFDRAQLALRYVLCVRGADVRPTEVESEEAEADAVAVEEKEPELAVDTSSIEAAVASVADAAVSPAAAAVDDDAMDVDL